MRPWQALLLILMSGILCAHKRMESALRLNLRFTSLVCAFMVLGALESATTRISSHFGEWSCTSRRGL